MLLIWFISTGLQKTKQASKDTMYSSGLISHGNSQWQYQVMPAMCIPSILVETYRQGLAHMGLQSHTTQSGPQEDIVENLVKNPIFICIITAIITKRNNVSLLENIFSLIGWLIHSFVQQTVIKYVSQAWSQTSWSSQFRSQSPWQGQSTLHLLHF